jgi:hypothetical protein
MRKSRKTTSLGSASRTTGEAPITVVIAARTYRTAAVADAMSVPAAAVDVGDVKATQFTPSCEPCNVTAPELVDAAAVTIIVWTWRTVALSNTTGTVDVAVDPAGIDTTGSAAIG